MLMKKILIMTLFAVVSLAAYSQNSVTVCVADPSGSPTNIRNAPNGKVVYQMTDSEFCTVDIVSVKNGWWKILLQATGYISRCWVLALPATQRDACARLLPKVLRQ